jgi:UDP-N-acetylglucosamine 2-epimerase (non-hydrolysing)
LPQKRLHIPVAHVEAGLRSGDLSMPEEIDRLVTDSISDWFVYTEPVSVDSLIREGKPKNSIFHLSRVMVDNLLFQRDRLASETQVTFHSAALKKQCPRYGVITLHRPSSVDEKQALQSFTRAFNTLSKSSLLIFPVHPPTRANLERFGITMAEQVVMTGPLSFLDFLNLWKYAVSILTDSCGLQEETTTLGVPYFTLRDNTERPITLDQGTNILAGRDEVGIVREAEAIIEGRAKVGRCPKLWDGHAAECTVKHLREVL